MQDGGEARIWSGIQKVPGHSGMPLKGHEQFIQIPLAFVTQNHGSAIKYSKYRFLSYTSYRRLEINKTTS
jgi:hypothetical protein